MTWQSADDATPTGDYLTDLIHTHLTPLVALQKQSEEEEALRKRYPALQAAWDNYLLTLRLVKGESESE